MCRSCWKRWKNNGIVRKPLRFGFGYPFCKRGNAPCPRRGGAPHPRRGQKGRDTCGFPSSLNSYLSLVRGSGADCRHVTAAKWGNGRGFFLCYGRTTFGVHPLEQPIRSVRYITATHVISSKQAQHARVAQLVSLEVTDGTYESIYLVAFILADDVRYNVPRICAALLCRALR